MSLETIYFLSSIVAAAGVIASLIFVGFQMRQNTKALKMESANYYQSSIGQIEYFIAQDKEFATLLTKGRKGQELDETEQLRLWVFYGNILRTWQNTYSQYLNNMLEQALWDGFITRLSQVFREDQGLVDHWIASHDQYTDSFNELVSSMVTAESRAKVPNSSH